MATVTHTEDLIEKQALRTVRTGGWRSGLANLLRKELGQWWTTSLWWIQLIIWVLLLNGVTTIVIITELQVGEMTKTELAQNAVQTFLQMGATVISIGAVITMQGAIVGEKQSGTAAWVLSKPASRPAFLVAKMVSYTLGFGVTAVLIPALLFVVETRWLFPLPVSLSPFIAGVVLMALNVMFYLMLTIMLGTVFDSRGPVIGIGITIAMAGMLFKSLLPMSVLNFTPWLLGDIGSGLANNQPLPANWIVPVAATACWAILFAIAALWRFSREDF